MGKLRTLKPRVALAETQRGTVITGGSWRGDKLTAAQRGYGHRWQRERAKFLREHPLCAACQREGRTVRAEVVDHVIPHRGDQTLFWDRTNWGPLCRPHHDEKTKREQREL